MKRTFLRIGDEVGIGAAREGVTHYLDRAIIVCLTGQYYESYTGNKTVTSDTGGDAIVVAMRRNEDEFWRPEVVSAQKVICPWEVVLAKKNEVAKERAEQNKAYEEKRAKEKALNDKINAICLERDIPFHIKDTPGWSPDTKSYIDHETLALMLGIEFGKHRL